MTTGYELRRCHRVLHYQQLTANLHELRLTFMWPQLPNGNVGPGRQTFRTRVAGQIVQTNYKYSQWLYFYPSAILSPTRREH